MEHITKKKAYFKTIGLFTCLFLFLISAMTMLDLYAQIEVPDYLSALSPIIATLCASLFFMRLTQSAPTRRDTWTLTLGSLVMYTFTTHILQIMGGIPFIPIVFVSQLVTGLVIFYIFYGSVARKIHAKDVKAKQKREANAE